MKPYTIVFACTHNAGRSQMAKAFFNHVADQQQAKAISAGTKPAAEVHPEVMVVMREKGFDLSHEHPTLLTPELVDGATLLITMGCAETCPVVPGAEVVDWNVEDPKGKPIETVRAIRDTIHMRVNELVTSRGWLKSNA